MGCCSRSDFSFPLEEDTWKARSAEISSRDAPRAGMGACSDTSQPFYCVNVSSAHYSSPGDPTSGSVSTLALQAIELVAMAPLLIARLPVLPAPASLCWALVTGCWRRPTARRRHAAADVEDEPPDRKLVGTSGAELSTHVDVRYFLGTLLHAPAPEGKYVRTRHPRTDYTIDCDTVKHVATTGDRQDTAQ